MTELAVRTCVNPGCGKQFLPYSKHIVTCSAACQSEWRKLNPQKGTMYTRVCKGCGETFTTHNKLRIYCGKECSSTNSWKPYEKRRGRFIILERDNFQCIYCGASPRQQGVSLDVDHVYPLVHGGDSTAANLVTACERCNGEKHGRVLPPAMQAEILAIVEQRNQDRGINPQMIIKQAINSRLARMEKQLAVMAVERVG